MVLLTYSKVEINGQVLNQFSSESQCAISMMVKHICNKVHRLSGYLSINACADQCSAFAHCYSFKRYAAGG